MAETKLQTVVAQQLPEFIREDYDTFVQFLKAYYEYLDIVDKRDLAELRDVDSTLYDYITYINSELGLISAPDASNLYVDPRLLLRKSKQTFISKGTEESYKFLFKVLYNKDVDVSYPWDSVLKASDGKWNQDTSIFAQFPSTLNVSAPKFSSGIVYTIKTVGNTNWFNCGVSTTTAVIANISGTTLTVTAINSGMLIVGQTIIGTGIPVNTKITKIVSGYGAVNTVYTIDTAPTNPLIGVNIVNSTQGTAVITASVSGNTMTVTGVTSGGLSVGQQLYHPRFNAGTTITAIQSGTGGRGTYLISESYNLTDITISAVGVDTQFVANGAGTGSGYASTTDPQQAAYIANSFVGNQVLIIGNETTVKVISSKATYVRDYVYELSLDKNFYGILTPGDQIYLMGYDSYATLIPTVVGYTIDSGNNGTGWALGDLIVCNNQVGSITISQVLKVTKVDKDGGILKLSILKFGAGYQDDFLFLASKQSIQSASKISGGLNGAPNFALPDDSSLLPYIDYGYLINPNTWTVGNESIGNTTIVGRIDNGAGAAGTTLTVTSLTQFILPVGSIISGTGVTANTTITGIIQTTVSPFTYTVSASQLVGTPTAPVSMTTSVGTVATPVITVSGSITVTGTSTQFTKQVAVGDMFQLIVGGVTYNIGYVTAIASNTSLTVMVPSGVSLAVQSAAQWAIGVNQYADPSYTGDIKKTFYSESPNGTSTITDNLALINFKVGAVAKYQGYYTANDGFISDTVYIQDSKYYQKYSYLLKINEKLETYKSFLKSSVHPAGTALYSDYQIQNNYKPGIIATQTLSQYVSKATFNTINKAITNDFANMAGLGGWAKLNPYDAEVYFSDTYNPETYSVFTEA
jgi:hypothetical protein